MVFERTRSSLTFDFEFDMDRFAEAALELGDSGEERLSPRRCDKKDAVEVRAEIPA